MLKGMPKAAQYFPDPSDFSDDRPVSLQICQCSACGLVQLNAEPVDYYKEVITAASFSDKARQSRLEQFGNLVRRFDLCGKTILDVGSGEGALLDVLKDVGLTPTGIEAASKSVAIGQAAGRNLVNGYIEELTTIPGSPFACFTLINYLEHLPYPGRILTTIHRHLQAGAVGVITVPNLAYLLRERCLYEFVADHLSYFTTATLSQACERTGFEVLECTTINEDNDLFALVRKRTALNPSAHLPEFEELIRSIRSLIERYTLHQKRVAVWGAGHRTLALLALGAFRGIEYVVDSARFKQGKFTPVTHLPIVAPGHLTTHPVDLVLVMVPGQYPSEVVATIKRMNLAADVAVHRGNRVDFQGAAS
jgi:2-polyprenyl-3-methyl-5-hydroxy-6-metoxy-1,4-benzoquinol methylase